MDLFRAQRGMLKQAFAQVREVSIRVSIRGDTLVDLTYMHARPRDIFCRQRPQHDPRSVTATDSHDKAATSSDRRTSMRGDCRRSRSRDRIGIIKHFELHRALSRWDQSDSPHIECADQSQPSYARPALSAAWAVTRKSSSSVAVGSCQPPAGETLRSASPGPQAPFSYS